MALSSIGKGIALLARKSQYGTEVADRIARKLSALDDRKIATLEKQLSFDYSLFSRRPPDANDILDLRRAAILCKETIQGPLALVDAKGKQIDPTSWDSNRLHDYLRACTSRELGVQPADKAYMAASFWAFASTQERSAASAGLKEGRDLCVAGLDLIDNRRGSTPVRDVCLSLWFGELSEHNLNHVTSVLRDTLGGLNSQPICLHYAGAGVDSDTLRKDARGYVRVGAGWGSAIKSDPHEITLQSKYFSSEKTSGPRTTAIKMKGNEMQVSRGGAMLHEATHLYGYTDDVFVPDTVYEFLKMAVPVEEARRAQAYGPRTCSDLSKVDPSLAIKNAENYRLFCEDAVIFIREGKS